MDGSYYPIGCVIVGCLQFNRVVGVSFPWWKYNLLPNKTVDFLRTWTFNSVYHSPYQLQGILSAFNHSAWNFGAVAAYNTCVWGDIKPSIALVRGSRAWNHIPNIGRGQAGADNVHIENIVAKAEGYKGFTPRLCAFSGSNRFDLYAYSPCKLLHSSITWLGLLDYDVCGQSKP